VTGRRANLEGLGLDSAGLPKDTRFLAVDGQLRAGNGIWAVGDVTGEGAFTHVASYQARIATGSILGTPLPDADYRALPRVTFTDPEVGSVGLSPKAARAQGLPIRVGSTQVAHTARGWLHKVGNEGFIELVEDAEAGILIGATSVGPAGGEVLGLLTLAVHARVPVSDLQSMIYAYPTFHRGVEDALRALA
jgi:pyruvate/2-oxoglutarate dehydrogenase complex dihydrolipoamide dehydrogenase (E3) component